MSEPLDIIDGLRGMSDILERGGYATGSKDMARLRIAADEIARLRVAAAADHRGQLLEQVLEACQIPLAEGRSVLIPEDLIKAIRETLK